MRKKSFIALLFALVFLLGTLPAFAESPGLDGITTFGYSDLRDRSFGVNSLGFWPSWMSDFGQNIGASYSQPLIVHDSSDSQENVYVIAAGGGNNPTIMIWKDIQADPATTYLQNDTNPPVWSATLPGNLATFSHPSLYKMNGRDILFIGTNASSGGAHIMAWDVTNVLEGKGSSSETPLLNKADPYASDIVSAPLLEYWQGHPVVIYTDGNSSRIDVAYNIDSLDNAQSPDKPLFQGITIGPGGGRTSSSPAPVMNGAAFVVGWDDGGSNGGIYVYRLDDIFTTGADGSMTVKDNVQPYGAVNTYAGMDQSFSVDPSNTNVVYFGDSRGNVYGLDIGAKAWVWPVNRDIPNTYGSPDDFSNRSPALDGTNIYFPFGTKTSTDFGGVIAVNKNTGQTSWISNGGKSPVSYDENNNPGSPTNAQTAPVVANLTTGQGKYILEGLGSGQIVALDASNGQEYPWLYQSGIVNQISSYAKGITGEISAYADYFAVTYDDGIIAGSLVPTDLAVTDPDNPGGSAKIDILDGSGQPVQQDSQGNFVVKAGQTYKVRIGYEYLASPDGSTNGTAWELPNVPVAGLHNVGGTWDSQTGKATGGTWYSFQKLTDQTGQALPQKPLYSWYASKSENEFYVDLQHQGSNGEYDFDWTPTPGDADSANFIGGAINLQFQTQNMPLIQLYPDNPLNNLIEVPVKIEAPVLQVRPSQATVQVSGTAQYTATFYPLGPGNSPGQDVTDSATWSSSAPGVGAVNGTGLATGKSVGSTQIQATYSGMAGSGTLNVTAPPAPNQSGGMTFQAVSQAEHDGYGRDGTPLSAAAGRYAGAVMAVRPPGTALWTDWVTATLTPPSQNMVGWGYGGSAVAPTDGATIAPPSPSHQPQVPQGASIVGAQSHMTDWQLTAGAVVYPAKNPNFSFGDPERPVGTTSTDLSVNGHMATATFHEEWAENGVRLHDPLNPDLDSWIQTPQSYTITAKYNYSLDYYEVWWIQPPPPPNPPPGSSPPPPYSVETYSGPYTPDHGLSLSGQLLVNGTGSGPVGI